MNQNRLRPAARGTSPTIAALFAGICLAGAAGCRPSPEAKATNPSLTSAATGQPNQPGQVWRPPPTSGPRPGTPPGGVPAGPPASVTK